jgi:cyanate lyase
MTDSMFNFIKWRKETKGLTWTALAEASGISEQKLLAMCLKRVPMDKSVFQILKERLEIDNSELDYHYFNMPDIHNLEKLVNSNHVTYEILQYVLQYDIAILENIYELNGKETSFFNPHKEVGISINDNNLELSFSSFPITPNEKAIITAYDENTFSEFTQKVLEAKETKKMTYELLSKVLGVSKVETVMLIFSRFKIDEEMNRKLLENLGLKPDECKQPHFFKPYFSQEVIKNNRSMFSLYKALCFYGDVITEMLHEKNGSNKVINGVQSIDVNSIVDKDGSEFLELKISLNLQ